MSRLRTTAGRHYCSGTGPRITKGAGMVPSQKLATARALFGLLDQTPVR